MLTNEVWKLKYSGAKYCGKERKIKAHPKYLKKDREDANEIMKSLWIDHVLFVPFVKENILHKYISNALF